MPSFRERAVCEEMIRRLDRLTPSTRPKWGTLDAPRMLCHIADTLAMAVGDLPVPLMNYVPLRHFPLKHLILYVFPFPKGARTAKELLSSVPGNIDSDRRRVVELIRRLASAPHASGPQHPIFGRLTNDEWNVLQCKHLEHHLRQFGC
jgi:hypothetical protein